MRRFLKFINFKLFKKDDFLILIILLIFIPQILNGFIEVPNWDLYNNLYYGSRLTQGELLWKVEFHDKFPLIQYIPNTCPF